MLVDTVYNVGDKVWTAQSREEEYEETCTSCSGEGGACIPGTRIRIECQECKGSGEATFTREVWVVREVRIARIQVAVRRYVANKDYVEVKCYEGDGGWPLSIFESQAAADSYVADKKAKEILACAAS